MGFNDELSTETVENSTDRKKIIMEQTKVDFENTYPELAEEFKKIQTEQYELFAAKMLDYGLGNIALGSDLSNPEDKNLSITGIWLRCNDKINRLKNLLKRGGKNYVEGEGLIDSFIDISNYGIIAQLVLRNKWK
jgi:hypothetical protein